MFCPFCKKETKVTDSRTMADSVRRRRECVKCGKRFTTFETIDLSLEVHKRDGTYEEFNEEKIINGLKSACFHTRVSHDQILNLVNCIKAELATAQKRCVESKDLGQMVMKNLRKLDIVAYIRFACVYKRFMDIGELQKEIASVARVGKLKKEKKNVVK